MRCTSFLSSTTTTKPPETKTNSGLPSALAEADFDPPLRASRFHWGPPSCSQGRLKPISRSMSRTIWSVALSFAMFFLSLAGRFYLRLYQICCIENSQTRQQKDGFCLKNDPLEVGVTSRGGQMCVQWARKIKTPPSGTLAMA